MVFRVPGGFSWFKVGFHDSRWVFMVFHGSRLAFYGARPVFMVFHGSMLVFMVLRVQVGFSFSTLRTP